MTIDDDLVERVLAERARQLGYPDVATMASPEDLNLGRTHIRQVLGTFQSMIGVSLRGLLEDLVGHG
jgi:hypothetical protein